MKIEMEHDKLKEEKETSWIYGFYWGLFIGGGVTFVILTAIFNQII